MSKVADLQVGAIAVHEVFTRDLNHQVVPPRYSESLTVLPDAGLSALKLRLTKALGSNSKSVEMSIANYQPANTFALCASALGTTDPDFLSISKQIAQRLAGAQGSRAIPGGVVVVLRGTVGLNEERCRYVAVIKAEVHPGFLKETRDTGPVITFLESLLLTPQQKLHKIGIFIEKSELAAGSDIDPDNFTAFVFDSEMVSSEISTAATYFYDQFLGCKPAASARKLTREFFQRSKSFIDESSQLDDEAKVECVTALCAYLRSNKQSVHLREFAEGFLPPEVLGPYVQHMQATGFPDIAVQKDTTTIKSQLRIRKLNFTTEVRILAPAERFNELVKIEHSTDDSALVRIQGRLTCQQ